VKRLRTTIVFIIFFSISYTCQSQLYLQIEKINSTELIKIPVGSTIVFKASSSSDEWQRGKIEDIDYESGTIIFDHTFMSLKEIEKIKVRNFGGEAMAWALKGFGFSWLIMGAIIDLADLNEQKQLDAQNLLIGALSIGTGFFIEKVSGDKIYTHNKTHRFRLIDLRFSIDE